MTPPNATARRTAFRAALALRDVQDYAGAEASFAAALRGDPDDVELLFGLAQTRFERGLPAADLFARARSQAPTNLDLARNYGAALASEGQEDAAEALFRDTLKTHPDWLDGHKALSTLLWRTGQAVDFAESYRVACDVRPQDAQLWLAWFRITVLAKDYPAAAHILDQAEHALGTTPAILVARLFLAVEECADDEVIEALLKKTATFGDDTVNLCRIRYFLRKGRLRDAERVAIPQLITPSANLFWPYLSLVWRLAGDARAEWIDRPAQFIRMQETDLSGDEVIALASLVRSLHTAQAPYIEQSVRGGTQTDRSILLRSEPLLQRARDAFLGAVRAYIDQLPPYEQGHPLIGHPRHNPLLIEGSWSVRLRPQGHNVPHTHPLGWISATCYIDLPDEQAMGPEPAGQIAFGTPPAELGLDLKPYAMIKPALGHIAIFPSTTWHSTVPFDAGERLVIAFDIRPPR
jgi:Tfp pilus assembly protein PilF